MTKKIPLELKSEQYKDFRHALFKLFHAEKADNLKPTPKTFSARQQHKLSQGLFFGQAAKKEQLDKDGNPIPEPHQTIVKVSATSEQLSHAKLQAALMSLETDTETLTGASAELETLQGFYAKKRQKYQVTETVELGNKSNPLNFNRQRALKYFYQLLCVRRSAQLIQVPNFKTILKSIPIEHKNALTRLQFQTLLYKHAAVHAVASRAAGADCDEVKTKYQAEFNTLLKPLAEKGTPAAYVMAKAVYRLLNCPEFDSNESDLVRQHLQTIVAQYLRVQKVTTDKSTLLNELKSAFEVLYQDVPMSVDPDTGIPGILNTCHDFFASLVSYCNATCWLVFPLLRPLFKGAQHSFAMFKTVHQSSQPNKMVNNLIDVAFAEQNEQVTVDTASIWRRSLSAVAAIFGYQISTTATMTETQVQHAKLAQTVKTENWYRTQGYISAVTAAFGYGVITAVALAALGGVPFLWAMVVGVLISGQIANYYLHKAYVPNTLVRFRKGVLKGLTAAQKIMLAGGIVLALLASLAVCAITYVDINYALLQVFAHLGWISLGGMQLSFALAATPWLVMPLGGLFIALLVVSLFISFEIFLTNFPIYVKDYTDFIRDRKWNDVLSFFKAFFGKPGKALGERVATTIYNLALLGLVVAMTVSLMYFAMLPTSIAFGASAIAVVGILKLASLSQGVYHAIVWGNMLANVPFVLKNIIEFCQRTAKVLATMVMATVACARILWDARQRQSFKEAMTWPNLKQAVREIAGIKGNASTAQVMIGALVFVVLISTLFVMVVLNAFGNGKVGQEGGEFLIGSAPLHLSKEAAELQVLGQSSFMSYLFCYQSVFPNQEQSDPVMLSSSESTQRAQYNQLLEQCDPAGFTVSADKKPVVTEDGFCKGMQALFRES